MMTPRQPSRAVVEVFLAGLLVVMAALPAAAQKKRPAAEFFGGTGGTIYIPLADDEILVSARAHKAGPIVTEGRLLNENGQIGIASGFAIGISVFDGVAASGFGRLNLDKRRIADGSDEEARSTFFYFNIQAVSAVGAAIKRVR